MNNLPYKIENCPIIDAIIEVRFETDLFKDAVFGYIYQTISSEFNGAPQPLPILQIPEPIRAADPNMQFKPHYRLENEKYIVQIGPDVFTISSKIPYIGWGSIKEYAESIFHKVFSQQGFIKKVVRLGIRYINVFDGIVVDNLKVKLSVIDIDYTKNNTQIRTEVKKGDYNNVLQVMSDVIVNVEGRTEKRGTLLDIDTSREFCDDTFIRDYSEELDKAHNAEKELFFSLIDDDLLRKLNPKYSE